MTNNMMQMKDIGVEVTDVTDSPITLGKAFINVLASRDFQSLVTYFHPDVRFRALIPSEFKQAMTAEEAVEILRDWYGDKDTLAVEETDVKLIADRLSLSYLFRVHDQVDGWQIIGQNAICVVRDGKIAHMWLICTGFRGDPLAAEKSGKPAEQAVQPRLGGDAFYNAGSKGCAEGPLDDIATLMRQLKIGQTLEIHATDPSVASDLPAWCHLSGNEFVKKEADYFLLRHK